MGLRRIQPLTCQSIRRLPVHPIHEDTTVVAFVLLQIDLVLAPRGVDHQLSDEISSLPAVCGKAVSWNPPLPPIAAPHLPDIRTVLLNATTRYRKSYSGLRLVPQNVCHSKTLAQGVPRGVPQ